MECYVMPDTDLMVLSSVEAGRKVRLVEIKAGRALRERFAALGLLPNVEIVVIRNENRGQIIISVKDSRIALGRGMTNNVYVA